MRIAMFMYVCVCYCHYCNHGQLSISSSSPGDQRGVFEEVDLYLLQPSRFVIRFGMHLLNVVCPLIAC